MSDQDHNSMSPEEFETLVYRYMDQKIEAREMLQLNEMLKSDPRWAALFVRITGVDATLQEHFQDQDHEQGHADCVLTEVPQSQPKRRLAWKTGIALAASVLLVVGLATHQSQWHSQTSNQGSARLKIIVADSDVIVRRGRAELKAEDGMLLQPEDIVATGKDRQAVLGYQAESTFLTLESNSELQHIVDVSKRLVLEKGLIHVTVSPQPEGHPMVIQTPHAEVKVLGTRFSLGVASEETQLDVRKGLVEIAKNTGKQNVKVAGDQYAVVSEDKPLKALPAVPIRPRGTAKSISPGQSLTKAIQQLLPGDTLNVAPGVYNENIEIIHVEGAPEAPITIRGTAGAIVEPQKGRDGILCMDSSHLVIENLQFNNAGRAGILAVHANHVTVRNCVMRGNGRWGIHFRMSDDVEVESCEVTLTQKSFALNFSATDRLIIKNCHIHRNRSSALLISGSGEPWGDGISSNGVIQGNRIFGNGDGVNKGSTIHLESLEAGVIRNNLLFNNDTNGINLYRSSKLDAGRLLPNKLLNNTIIKNRKPNSFLLHLDTLASKHVIVQNNIFVNHGGPIYEVEAESLLGINSNHNVFYQSSTRNAIALNNQRMTLDAWRARSGKDRESHFADPKFVDPKSGDYHLGPRSPAIDAGVTWKDISKDLDGKPVPHGRGPDIGAYERQD